MAKIARGKRLNVYLTPDELREVHRASQALALTASGWLRYLAVREIAAARRTRETEGTTVGQQAA